MAAKALRSTRLAHALRYTLRMTSPNFVGQARALATRALEAALQRLLALDPDLGAQLLAFEGKQVVLQLSKPDLRFTVTVRAGTLSLKAVDSAPDLTLSTTPGSLFALLAQRSGLQMPVGKLHISGDAELARQLQGLSKTFDPDWDEPFSRLFGDVAGFQIARGVRKASAWVKDSAQAFVESSAEYLTEEGRDVVPAAELEQFFDEVDKLRDALARAELRVKRLASKP